jgi:hypothetical protein
MKRLMIIVIALLLGIGLPFYVWHFGGIWRFLAIALIGMDILELVTQGNGPLAFLWKLLSGKPSNQTSLQ